MTSLQVKSNKIPLQGKDAKMYDTYLEVLAISFFRFSFFVMVFPGFYTLLVHDLCLAKTVAFKAVGAS